MHIGVLLFDDVFSIILRKWEQMLSGDRRNCGVRHFTEMNFLSSIFLVSLYSVIFSLIISPVRAMSSGKQLKAMSSGKQLEAMSSGKQLKAMSSGKQLEAMSSGKQLKAKSSDKSRGKRELSNDQRSDLYQFLLKRSHDGKPEHGSINAAAEEFAVTRRTVSRIWHQGKLSIKMGASVPDVSSQKAGNVGRKKINLDLSRVKGIPLEQRTNIRSLANALNVPKSTLHSRLKDGQLKVNSGIQHQLAAIYDT